jgi:hypothetical protein
MPNFMCPACASAHLQIQSSIELPPSGADDEIAVQTVECGACRFAGIAVYRESRHGALDSESWNHTGFELEPGDLEKLLTTILSCSTPQDRRCRCEAHKELANEDWVAPARRFTVRREFKMDLA